MDLQKLSIIIMLLIIVIGGFTFLANWSSTQTNGFLLAVPFIYLIVSGYISYKTLRKMKIFNIIILLGVITLNGCSWAAPEHINILMQNCGKRRCYSKD